MQQVTINGSVHEDSSIISQQPLQQPQQQLPPLQQQQQQQPYITEQTTQEQFQPESEQDVLSQQQQQQPIKTESHPTSEETNEQPETEEGYTPSTPETETEHQVSSPNTISSGPKTYANLVKCSVGTTSPQVPKPPMSPTVSTHHNQLLQCKLYKI